jgi:hypothetical protein
MDTLPSPTPNWKLSSYSTAMIYSSRVGRRWIAPTGDWKCSSGHIRERPRKPVGVCSYTTRTQNGMVIKERRWISGKCGMLQVGPFGNNNKSVNICSETKRRLTSRYGSIFPCLRVFIYLSTLSGADAIWRRIIMPLILNEFVGKQMKWPNLTYCARGK